MHTTLGVQVPRPPQAVHTREELEALVRSITNLDPPPVVAMHQVGIVFNLVGMLVDSNGSIGVLIGVLRL